MGGGGSAGIVTARVQIITRQYGDLTSIRFAELLEKDYAGFVPPPGY